MYKKGDELSKIHRNFGIGFIFKSRRIKIQLTKE